MSTPAARALPPAIGATRETRVRRPQHVEAFPSAIDLRGVVKDFDRQRVLDGVDLRVPEGQITVLIGPSGVGKTVSVKLMLGLLWPSAGTILIRGRDLSQLSTRELNTVRRELAVMFQGDVPFGCGLFASLDLFENVAYGLRERHGLPEDRVRELAETYLARVGLAGHARKLPGDLSAGMRKRAALARALALEAPLVILDDFESGVDGVRLAGLCALIREVHGRYGGTFLITTHDMDVVRRLADNVAVMSQGKIVGNGPAEELLDSAEASIRQLVRGERNGPVTLRSPAGAPGVDHERLYGEQYGFKALPLIAVGLLAVVAVILLVVLDLPL